MFSLSLLPLPNLNYRASDASGNSYSGVVDAATGECVGQVEISFASGARYSGGLGERGFSGAGEYRDASAGDGQWSIAGEFTDGYLQGQGSYEDARGSYAGGFRRSLPHGRGAYSSNQGWRYEGEFTDGVITGYGDLTFADGSLVQGRFDQGILVEQP
jgi:hypothetical protein